MSGDLAAVFRDADRALLDELDDEVVFDRLFAALTANVGQPVEPLPRRSSGLIAHIRTLDGGAAAARRVLDGAEPIAELGRFIFTGHVTALPPAMVHHVAVLCDRIADALELAFTTKPNVREAQLDARARSVALFAALHAEREYIVAYAKRVVGSALPPDEIEPRALGLVTGTIDTLAEKARAGARELTSTSELALAALGRVRHMAKQCGVDERTVATFGRRAESLRASAIDDALGAVLPAINDARVREAGVAELAKIFQKVYRIWLWSNGDDAPERFAVDEVTDFCWEIRRRPDLAGIGRVLDPCVPLYESLARKIETDPKHHIGYAAKCAQVFCFRSDATSNPQQELHFAERALKICNTHRNARATVAHILSSHAITALAAPFVTEAALAGVRAQIARATEIWPQSERLKQSKDKLAAHPKANRAR